jgi:hypothetical protein
MRIRVLPAERITQEMQDAFDEVSRIVPAQPPQAAKKFQAPHSYSLTAPELA